MSRVKNWCFTLNAKDGVLPPAYSALPTGARAIVFQHEKGTNDHYQGTVQFDDQIRLNIVKHRLGYSWIHLEPCKDLKGSIHYCTKPHVGCECVHCKEERANPTKVGDPVQLGEFVFQGQRLDREALFAKIKEEGYAKVALSNPVEVASVSRFAKEYDSLYRWGLRNSQGYRRPEIRVLVGPSGCGKTSYAFGCDPDLYTVAQANRSGTWFDGYSGEPTVLFDEFHSNAAIGDLLKWTDAWPIRVPVKGSHVPWQPELIFLCSNIPLEDWYRGVPPTVRQALFRRIHEFGFYLVWDSSEREFATGPIPGYDGVPPAGSEVAIAPDGRAVPQGYVAPDFSQFAPPVGSGRSSDEAAAARLPPRVLI